MNTAAAPGGARANPVLDTLLALSRSLSGAKQGGVLADALDTLLHGLGCARGAAYTKVGDTLELVGERGLPASLRASLERLSLTETPWFAAQKAARSRKLVIERRPSESGERAAESADHAISPHVSSPHALDGSALARARWDQVLACPIAAGREVHGALVLAWPADEDAHEAALAVEIACNVIAVQIARHSDEQRRAEARDGAVRSARMMGLGILASGFASDLGAQLAEVAKCLDEQRRMVDTLRARLVAREGQAEARAVRAADPAAALQIARESTARFLTAIEPSPPERVDLSEIATDVLALTAPHLHRRRVDFELRASGEHAVVGRRSELMQLFIQLVLGMAGVVDGADELCSDRSVLIPRAFALEVSRQGGHEVVSLSDAADSGTAARASFFDIGMQMGDPGFDIGVARQIVIAHEGHMELGPDERGYGTRCRVVLPVAASEAERRALRARPAAGARRAPFDGPRPIVVWIDEDDLFLEIMVQSLPDLDIRVARSAAEGMQLLAFGVSPALLLCNVRLPDRTGPQVHADIARQDPRLGDRFAFITDGVLTPEAAGYLISCGRPTLTRPIDLEQVRDLAQRDPAALRRANAAAPTLADLRPDPRQAPTAPAMRAAHPSEAPPTPINHGSLGPAASARSAARPAPPIALEDRSIPIDAEAPLEIANHGAGARPATMRDQELAAIARAIAETLRREGPKRGALVSGMLRARGLNEPEALAVITYALANRVLVRDPPPSTTLRVPDAEHRTVLVVDDDFDLRHTMREVLQDEGFVVATAGNGREALDLLRRNAPPRVVVLDLMMPVMDGWQLLDELKRDHALADIPVIVISASKKGLRPQDTHEILTKPLDYYRLVTTLERSMKARASA